MTDFTEQLQGNYELRIWNYVLGLRGKGEIDCSLRAAPFLEIKIKSQG